MNKKATYLFLVAAIVVGFIIWTWVKMPVSKAPEAGNPETNAAGADTTASINEDLEAVSVESANFQSIDADLDSL